MIALVPHPLRAFTIGPTAAVMPARAGTRDDFTSHYLTRQLMETFDVIFGGK